MPAIVELVLTASRVVAAAIRSGAVANPIPGTGKRMVRTAAMDNGIAERVNSQTASTDRNISGHDAQ
jgi:hypothetical protein